MKNVNNKLELKIYEKLGVRKFRNIIVKILYFVTIGPFRFSKIPKEELEKCFYDTPSNYFLKKGNGIKDLKDFKKFLFLNTSIHIFALIYTISCITNGSFIVTTVGIILNLYCILLQRYNQIRINNTIKKCENFENRQRNKLKEEIKENSTNPYIIHFKKEKQENINIDKLLNSLNLDQLKKLKIDLMNYDSSYSDRFDTTIYDDNNKHTYLVMLTKKKR